MHVEHIKCVFVINEEATKATCHTQNSLHQQLSKKGEMGT